MVLVATLAITALPAQGVEAPSESEVKALYVYNFLRFVEWPSAARDSVRPIRIGLLHEDPFDGHLQRIVRDRETHGPPILINVCQLDDADLQGHDVIVVGAAEFRFASDLLQRVRQQPILTVGEDDGFLHSGGVINLVRVGPTVKFDVNLGAAELSGIRLSSGLLRVARRVVRKS